MKDIQRYAVHGTVVPVGPVAVGTAGGCHEALPYPNNSRAGRRPPKEKQCLSSPCVHIVLKLDRVQLGFNTMEPV